MCFAVIYYHRFFQVQYHLFSCDTIYSGPFLIRPPYLPRNCGHISEVAFGERGKLNTLIVTAENSYGSEKVASVESATKRRGTTVLLWLKHLYSGEL